MKLLRCLSNSKHIWSNQAIILSKGSESFIWPKLDRRMLTKLFSPSRDHVGFNVATAKTRIQRGISIFVDGIASFARTHSYDNVVATANELEGRDYALHPSDIFVNVEERTD